MGELISLKVGISEADLPSILTRDPEYQAADAAHGSAIDPHPAYLTQAEGDVRYGTGLFSKVLTGLTATTQGGSVSVVHGLNFAKIVSINCLIEIVAGIPGLWAPENYIFNGGAQANLWMNATSISVGNVNGNSGLILNKPFRLVIRHTP